MRIYWKRAVLVATRLVLNMNENLWWNDFVETEVLNFSKIKNNVVQKALKNTCFFMKIHINAFENQGIESVTEVIKSQL